MTVIKMPKTDSAEWKARVELAATFRIANRLGWNEGIANHFSVQVGPDRYLLNPYELHFREVTASNLLLVNGKGDVLAGEGQVRRVAFYLHPRLHELLPSATAIIHAHPPYATAIACVKGGRFDTSHAIAMGLAKQLHYEDEMTGPVDEEAIQKLAKEIGKKTVIVHAMHGLTTVGASVADAFDSFYFTERWAMYTILARQMGGPVHSLDPSILRDSPQRDKGLNPPAAQAHLNAWMRVLDKDEGDYKN
ncbi:MAG: aldolase [Alphaproteobacteria bacterium]|nr:aldolase [Alphaproteobacteria bacterium]